MREVENVSVEQVTLAVADVAITVSVRAPTHRDRSRRVAVSLTIKGVAS